MTAPPPAAWNNGKARWVTETKEKALISIAVRKPARAKWMPKEDLSLQV